MSNMNIEMNQKTIDNLKMVALAASKPMNKIIDEVIMLGLEEYKKKYNGGNEDGE